MIACRLTLAVLVLGCLSFTDGAGPPATRPEFAKVRIGTYDTRSVAVAFAASSFNPVKEKMTEMGSARKTGDQQQIKSLEAWGEQHQRMLHLQGFCRVPVTDLLKPVQGELQNLAERQNLAAITMTCDAVGANVETIDVTDAIVELYRPSPKTREMAKQIRGTKPLSVLDVAGVLVTSLIYDIAYPS